MTALVICSNALKCFHFPEKRPLAVMGKNIFKKIIIPQKLVGHTKCTNYRMSKKELYLICNQSTAYLYT